MKYTLLLTPIALSLTFFTHAMESKKSAMNRDTFDNIFNKTSKPDEKLGPFRNAGRYLNRIRRLYKDAREKRDTLVQLKNILQERKAAGIRKHMDVLGTTVDAALATIYQNINEQAANDKVKKNIEDFEQALVGFINEKEQQCDEDITHIDATLESHFGMLPNPSFDALIENWKSSVQNVKAKQVDQHSEQESSRKERKCQHLSSKARKKTWKNTYNSLNILNTTEAEQDAIELLIQEEPVPIGKINTLMEEIKRERGLAPQSNDNDDDDDDDDDDIDASVY